MSKGDSRQSGSGRRTNDNKRNDAHPPKHKRHASLSATEVEAGSLFASRSALLAFADGLADLLAGHILLGHQHIMSDVSASIPAHESSPFQTGATDHRPEADARDAPTREVGREDACHPCGLAGNDLVGGSSAASSVQFGVPDAPSSAK